MNARSLFISWVENVTAGKPSDAIVSFTVSELRELGRELVDAKGKGGKGARGPRKQKGMTPHSRKRREIDTPLMAFARKEPCCFCTGRRGVQPNHFGTAKDKGIGMKPPNDQITALCMDCHHGEYHQHGTLPGMTRKQTIEFLFEENRKLIARFQAWQAKYGAKETF